MNLDGKFFGAYGHEANDHYHSYNPGQTGRHNLYLDKSGNPCSKGSNESHIYPGQ